MLRVRKAALKFTPMTLRQEDAKCVMETNKVLAHPSGRHKEAVSEMLECLIPPSSQKKTMIEGHKHNNFLKST